MTPMGRALFAAVTWLAASAHAASAQTGENILLVTNALSAASEEIGVYYSRARGIPNQNIVRLPLPIAEEIERAEYERKIERPLAEWLTAHEAQDRILYVVLTKDVPLRIAGTGGQNATVASVDSELTLLYRRMVGGTPVPVAGRVSNPYFRPDMPAGNGVRFTHKQFDIYLVGRLDGYTVTDVKAMIDRAASPSHEGRIVLDGKLELGIAVGNRWLENAATVLRRLPGWSDRVVLDTGMATLTNEQNLIGFYSWGSNAVAATQRGFGHQFLPGAIAAEFVSTDARTFKEPPETWTINNTNAPFGGSHQSLIGDFIRDGITGTAGHVAEPYLNGTIRPEALFPAYVSGFNLIESFYLAMPSLSWQTVVVGDPLCTPFPSRPAPATTDLKPPIDAETGLPELFATRRLGVFAAMGARPDVARLLAKAEVLSARHDREGRRQALEQATALDAEFAPANMALALMYEETSDWDAAIDRYRRVVTRSPGNAVALNSLAYLLSVRRNKPAEALPFAVRGYSVSVQDPAVGDTLAWIHHLMGDDLLALPVMTLAARRLPGNAEVQMHAAFIFAGTGNTSGAQRALEAALKLDPSLSERDDIKALQRRLKLPPK